MGFQRQTEIGKTGKHSSGNGASKHAGPAVEGRQSRSLNHLFSLATEFRSVPSLCQSLCWLRGILRRCSEPVQDTVKTTNINVTQNVLKWRKAQEKQPGSVSVGIRTLLREDFIHCISTYIDRAFLIIR